MGRDLWCDGDRAQYARTTTGADDLACSTSYRMRRAVCGMRCAQLGMSSDEA